MNRATQTQADFIVPVSMQGAGRPPLAAQPSKDEAPTASPEIETRPSVPADESGYVRLNDEEWALFQRAAGAIVRLRPNQHDADRIFVEAALTVMTGRRHWMQLPRERFGKWLHLHHRCSRWLERGIWSALAVEQAFGPELSRQVIEYSQRYKMRLEHQRRRRRARLLASDD